MATSSKLVIIFCFFLAFACAGQNLDQEQYKVKLDIYESGKLLVNDTVIPLSALSTKYKYGIPLIQFFKEFNYEKTIGEEINGKITLKAEDFQIIMIKGKLDSISFRKKYFNKRLDFLSNRFYTDIPREMFLKHPFYPDSELTELKIETKDKQKIFTSKEIGNIFNPYNINGYRADNGNILITIEGGDGTGAYVLIWVFNRNLDIIEKYEESVI